MTDQHSWRDQRSFRDRNVVLRHHIPVTERDGAYLIGGMGE
jgi:hypothetical protein